MDDKYEVECKVDHGDLYLSVTHNGYQWTLMLINNPEHEIPLMIKVLENKLKEIKDGV